MPKPNIGATMAIAKKILPMFLLIFPRLQAMIAKLL
jgi:hypothetical protein